jgi:uncharacterized membrane protein
MTEGRPARAPGPEPGPPGPESGLVNIVYILYLAGLIFGVTGVIGVIMAYVNRHEGPEWLWSHNDFQIRTFWIGLLSLVISSLLTLIFIGWLLILLWYIWVIVRCARGMKYLARGEPYPNPTSWLFG